MTDNSPAVSVSEEERLDAETEKMMSAILFAGWWHNEHHKGLFEACRPCQEDVTMLRKRIRTLIEEARESAIRTTESAWRTR